MKKKIEAELVSLAHRLLKMNNYKDTVQLHNDVTIIVDEEAAKGIKELIE